MMKCRDCGETFQNPEVYSYQECMGEFWGSPAYETFYLIRCPFCGSENLEDNDDIQSDN